MIARMSRVAAFSLICLVLGLGPVALAQAPTSPTPKPPASAKGKTPAVKPAPAKPAAKPAVAAPSAPPQPVVMPDAEKIVLLLRNTLITLNDAIQTGNYTVLRDKGAPGFRDANSAAKLGQIFSNLAQNGIDLSAVSVVTPQLTEAPSLDQQKGMLHVQGYFPLQTPVNFEVLYQSVGGRWRVFGLAVQPGAPAVQAAPAPASVPVPAPAPMPAPAQ